MAGDGQPYDLFGSSVAVSGEAILVGAVWEDGGPGNPVPEAGGAYLFERNQGGNGVWGQTAQLTAGDAQEDDRFGDSVAISGETIVVGARGEDGGPGDPLRDAGAAYVSPPEAEIPTGVTVKSFDGTATPGTALLWVWIGLVVWVFLVTGFRKSRQGSEQ
jgi:hypothetical protein